MPEPTEDYIDPRLLERVDIGDGQTVTMRRGAIGLVLADEAKGLVTAYADVSEDASYLLRELELCCSSVIRGTDAIFVSEWFIGWLFTRQIAECAIRAAWIAKGNNAAAVNDRIRRMAKRDWMLVLKADKSIADESGHGLIVNRDEVLTYGAGMPRHHAPLDVRGLANEAGTPGLYQIWRWASVLVHPGFGNYLHTLDIYKGRRVQRALHSSFARLTTSVLIALQALAPEVDPPDVSGSMATVQGGGIIDFGELDETTEAADETTDT